MMVEFQPMTDEQIAAESPSEYPLLEKGKYGGVIENAEEQTSKSGNKMLKLTVDINHGGRTFKVWDYLVFSAKTMWKVKQFAQAAKIMDRYEVGNIEPADCIGKLVRCSVGVDPAQGEYKAKNKISGYEGIESAPANDPPPIADADIPF